MDFNEPDATASPLARFGAELRRMRRAMGWSQTELGRRMGYSNGMVSYVERAKKPVTHNFAVRADEVFDTGGTFYELWRRYSRASLLEGFPEFAEAEGRCRKLRTFELSVMPGLFQTKEYASALAAAAVLRGSITEEQAAERVEFLANRQRIFEQKAAPVVHAVLDQSCLVRPVGGHDVMRAQLDHLEKLARLSNVTIQVAPFSLAEHVPFTMPIVLLTLPDRSVVGYAESQARGHLERGREAVAAWESDYDQLQVESLSKTASLSMIRAVRKEHE
ncbi:helix-turn-helix domain-containing protein [Kitasatospora sp. NPDC087861]|uniref:helix-turn-helix domain-containing protein n=1 Tax=Kitasatospora sp. NPDC087861 TaxID=3364070 RepID=UPI0037F1440D